MNPNRLRTTSQSTASIEQFFDTAKMLAFGNDNDSPERSLVQLATPPITPRMPLNLHSFASNKGVKFAPASQIEPEEMEKESPIGLLRALEEGGGSLLELAPDSEEPTCIEMPPEESSERHDAPQPLFPVQTPPFSRPVFVTHIPPLETITALVSDTEQESLPTFQDKGPLFVAELPPPVVSSSQIMSHESQTQITFPNAPILTSSVLLEENMDWTQEGRLRSRTKSVTSLLSSGGNVDAEKETLLPTSPAEGVMMTPRKAKEKARRASEVHTEPEKKIKRSKTARESTSAVNVQKKANKSSGKQMSAEVRAVSTPVNTTERRVMTRSRTDSADSVLNVTDHGQDKELDIEPSTDPGNETDDEYNPDPRTSPLSQSKTKTPRHAGTSSSAMPTPTSPEPLNSQYARLSKAEQKRIRNRIAARRSRERKLNRITELEAENEELVNELQKMKKELDYWMKKGR